MLYNSHKDRVWVGECFFWYQLTEVDLDKELLNGLLLLLFSVPDLWYGGGLDNIVDNSSISFLMWMC